MFKTLATLSILTTAALAQSSAIPSNISGNCSSFLTSLNSDNDVKTCLSALTTATSAYQPGSGTSNSSSTAQVGSALSNLCSSSVSSSCPESLIRGKLTDFYSSCASELASNQDVADLYDKLYVVPPLTTIACSKDNNGNYCATQAKLPSTGSTAQQIQQVLATSNSTPNITTFRANNIPFLFLTSASDNLCSDCTRNIMTAYLNFESKSPYAPGLNNSVILTQQLSLYTGITNKCGSSFLNGAGVQAAGGLSGGTLGNGAAHTTAGTGLATTLGALALIIASL